MEVFVKPIEMVFAGCRRFVKFGSATDALAVFYDKRIPPDGAWSVFPEIYFGKDFIGTALYYGNYDGNVDFYYQSRKNIGSDIFEKIKIYGITDPSYWYAGDKVYDGRVTMLGWGRAKEPPSRL